MIIPTETNKHHLSPLLEKNYPNLFKNFKTTLDENGVKPDYIPETKEVWCVDYKPMQITVDKFMQYPACRPL